MPISREATAEHGRLESIGMIEAAIESDRLDDPDRPRQGGDVYCQPLPTLATTIGYSRQRSQPRAPAKLPPSPTSCPYPASDRISVITTRRVLPKTDTPCQSLLVVLRHNSSEAIVPVYIRWCWKLDRRQSQCGRHRRLKLALKERLRSPLRLT